jgi:hypothetical protein
MGSDYLMCVSVTKKGSVCIASTRFSPGSRADRDESGKMKIHTMTSYGPSNLVFRTYCET